MQGQGASEKSAVMGVLIGVTESLLPINSTARIKSSLTACRERDQCSLHPPATLGLLGVLCTCLFSPGCRWEFSNFSRGGGGDMERKVLLVAFSGSPVSCPLSS